ncbi:MAG: hypothetical protein ABFD24_12405 [Anaerolineaceae bacterium]
MTDENFFSNPEPLLATLANLFASSGAAREVAVLANSTARIKQTSYDNWNGGTYGYSLFLQIPNWLYNQVISEIESIEKSLSEKANLLSRGNENEFLERVYVTPQIADDNEWREKAKAWLSGDGISNQGRVHSDNIPSRTMDGLLFRSQPEIFLYIALKSSGVSFAPLAVFIRGGESYKRIEPDFFIVKDGISLVVEVDGDTVHHETPVEAHSRTSMLVYEGVHIERVRASECESQFLANACAKKIMTVIEKLKSTR